MRGPALESVAEVLVERVIAGVLVLFVVQTLIAPTIRYTAAAASPADGLKTALGARDEKPPESPVLGRASRAQANLQEALPVFLTVALLHVFHGTGERAEVFGWAFLAARTLYVPAYLSGIPGVRTLMWASSWIGLGGLVIRLVW